MQSSSRMMFSRPPKGSSVSRVSSQLQSGNLVGHDLSITARVLFCGVSAAIGLRKSDLKGLKYQRQSPPQPIGISQPRAAQSSKFNCILLRFTSAFKEHRDSLHRCLKLRSRSREPVVGSHFVQPVLVDCIEFFKLRAFIQLLAGNLQDGFHLCIAQPFDQ